MKRIGDTGLSPAEGPKMQRLSETDTPVTYSWPANAVPVELFDLIIQHLSLSDAKNLRQVCREFAQKTTANVFHTFAAKFHPKLCTSNPDPSNPLGDLEYGRGLFMRHGHHITRFTLSLEIDEDDLASPPFKPTYEHVKTFWGSYKWPFPRYEYYKHLYGLVKEAGNPQPIAEMLASLPNLTEVAITLDPGWACPLGHERYVVAAKVLPHLRQGIGLPTCCRSRTTHTPYPAPDPLVRRQAVRERFDPDNMITYNDHAQQEAPPTPAPPAATDTVVVDLPDYPQYVEFLLRDEQRELVTELDEAAGALALSWATALATASLGGALQHVACLRLAKLPSKHIRTIIKAGFWDTLPSLNEVHLGVLPNWRQFSKQGEFLPNTQSHARPSSALKSTLRLLHLISENENITTLHFEWVCGGELSWGGQRGRFILPAPVMLYQWLTEEHDTVGGQEHIISFPHVTKLSLKNCWFPPDVFLRFVKEMTACSLVELKLESVSLSGPRSEETQQHRSGLLSLLSRFTYKSTQGPPVFLGPDTPYDFSVPVPPRQLVIYSIDEALYEAEEGEFEEVYDEAGNIVWPGMHGPAPAVVVEVPEADPPTEVPRLATWAEIIDALVPGHVGAGEPGGSPSPPSSSPGADGGAGRALKRMEFKSCGYVAVDTPRINSSHIAKWPALASYYRWAVTDLWTPDHPRVRPALENVGRGPHRGFGLLRHNQLDVSDTYMHGWVSPFIPEREWEVLEGVYGMRMGWEGVYDELTIALAQAVNPTVPGEGRFTGVVLGRHYIVI